MKMNHIILLHNLFVKAKFTKIMNFEYRDNMNKKGAGSDIFPLLFSMNSNSPRL
jgi:hypothetical protein